MDGVPLVFALERPTSDHAAAQLSLRAAPTTVLLLALGADGVRVGTPARDFQFYPAAWPLPPDLRPAAEALHPRGLLERVALTAIRREGPAPPCPP